MSKPQKVFEIVVIIIIVSNNSYFFTKTGFGDGDLRFHLAWRQGDSKKMIPEERTPYTYLVSPFHGTGRVSDLEWRTFYVDLASIGFKDKDRLEGFSLSKPLVKPYMLYIDNLQVKHLLQVFF